MKATQERLINKLRIRLNLSKEEISNIDLSYMASGTITESLILFQLYIGDFKKELYKAFMIPKKYLGENK